MIFFIFIFKSIHMLCSCSRATRREFDSLKEYQSLQLLNALLVSINNLHDQVRLVQNQILYHLQQYKFLSLTVIFSPNEKYQSYYKTYDLLKEFFSHDVGILL